jgi:SAM-dependent methyltransferase
MPNRLPFAHGMFDAVLCQFGVMFFPDKSRALVEAFRVLKPGGRFLFSVWDRIEANEFADAVVKAVADLDSTLTGRLLGDRRTRKIAPQPTLPGRGCNGEVGGFGSLPVCPSLRCPCLRAVICRLKPRHPTLSTRISDPGRHSGLIAFSTHIELGPRNDRFSMP